MGPTVAMIPIKIPPEREVFVLGTRIGDITHQDVDIILVLLHPLWIEVADRGRCENMITIVEMVVLAR
jgi:hypothetical protein